MAISLGRLTQHFQLPTHILMYLMCRSQKGKSIPRGTVYAAYCRERLHLDGIAEVLNRCGPAMHGLLHIHSSPARKFIGSQLAVCQNSWDLWIFIPLKMVLMGIDPYPTFRV